jgi:DNA-binding NarL/FixJ family response regulator
MILIHSTNFQVQHHWQMVLENELNYQISDSLDNVSENSIVLFDAQNPLLSISQYLEHPLKPQVIALQVNPTVQEGLQLLQLGIRGYSPALNSKIHLLDTIKMVESGNIWLYPEFIQAMVTLSSQQKNPPKKADLSALSKREEEVALLVSKGLSNKEIALKTKITERTIKAHLSKIFVKLNANDRLGLALYIN